MTEPGAPYGGPPPTTPPAWGQPAGWGSPPGWGQAQGWGQPPGWGAPGYGEPSGYGLPWGPQPGYGPGWPPSWAPTPARRPGAVTGAAVLSFVQFGLVLLGTVYLFFIAALVGTLSGVPDAQLPAGTDGLAVEGLVLAGLQLAADVVLLVAAIRALRSRTRGTWRFFAGALGAHVVLAGYWFVRLQVLRGAVPGDAAGALAGLSVWTVLFAALPLVALGLVVLGAGRRWFDAGNGPARG